MPRGQYERRGPAQSDAPQTETANHEPSEVVETQSALSPRAAETRRERRRRDDGNLDRMGRMALSIPPEVQERWDREGKVGRWVRDVAGRQTQMHREDWDVTTGVEPVPEGRESEGKLVLMEKYRDWYDEDQRRKTGLLDERETAIKRGLKTEPGDNRQESVSYVPEGNSFSRKPGL